MKVLALEPYDGGSHAAFLRGWADRSRHDFEIHGLPPHKWKWRMRHAAIHFAELVRKRGDEGASWDLVFCSDMLNLAEFLGLAPNTVRDLPRVVYFHENQLSYPVRDPSERDYQFAFTNLTTALAATRVWFNSAFHRDDFLTALEKLLRKMPDHRPLSSLDLIREHSEIQHPGVPDPGPREKPRAKGPLRLLWAARWEHDKNPDALLEAARALEKRSVAFELSVIGERFRNAPEAFTTLEQEFRHRLKHFGWLESREAYEDALHSCDVFVSTANHEFYGLAAAEAILAEAWPLLPDRLAYPELLGRDDRALLYNGEIDDLVRQIELRADRLNDDERLRRTPPSLRERHLGKAWPLTATRLDEALERALQSNGLA